MVKTTQKRRLLAYVLVAIIAAVGLWRYHVVSDTAHDAALQAKTTALAEAEEDERDEALQCVTSWDVRSRIRDAITLAANGDRAALVEAIGPFAKSQVNLKAFTEAYREVQTRWIEQAKAKIPDPTCNRRKSEAILQSNGGGKLETPMPIVGAAPYSHFNLGLHWRRQQHINISPQTVIYFENHLASYHGPLVAKLANQLNSHPYLYVRMVAKCPVGRNCLKWYTANTRQYGWAGVTGLTWGNDKHILSGYVKLDQIHGGSWAVVWHEGCHGLGGGFGNSYQHSLCNQAYAAHHWQSLSVVYRPHAGG